MSSYFALNQSITSSVHKWFCQPSPRPSRPSLACTLARGAFDWFARRRSWRGRRRGVCCAVARSRPSARRGTMAFAATVSVYTSVFDVIKLRHKSIRFLKMRKIEFEMSKNKHWKLKIERTHQYIPLLVQATDAMIRQGLPVSPHRCSTSPC